MSCLGFKTVFIMSKSIIEFRKGLQALNLKSSRPLVSDKTKGPLRGKLILPGEVEANAALFNRMEVNVFNAASGFAWQS